MAEQAPPSGLPAKKSKAPAYELVVDEETGAMRRVPIATAKAAPTIPAPSLQPLPPSAAPAPRTAITSAALASVRPPEVEEELVFNETGELTGAEREAALQAAPPPPPPPPVPAPKPKEEPAPVAAPAKKPRRPKQTLNWTSLSDVEKMQQIYRYRNKYPSFFVYTAEGNLLVKENNPVGLPAGTVTLRAFSSLRPEELEELETQRKDHQEDVEAKYVVKLKELRTAYDMYQASAQDTSLAAAVVKLNEEVRQLSVLRNKALYPEQWTSVVDNPEIRSILLNQTHEERKFGYDIYLYKRLSMARADVEGHYRPHGEGAGGQEGGGETTVLFLTDTEDPRTGQFHPATETEFVFHETKYASPYQAFEVERFKELGEEDMIQKLLGTRSWRTIKQLVSQEPRRVKEPLALWQDILEALYTQHKPMAEALKETGSARFHMMDKQIGTPEYSNALVAVRTKLKERDDEAPSGPGDVNLSVISRDQQQKDKVGAIINTVRRR